MAKKRIARRSKTRDLEFRGAAPNLPPELASSTIRVQASVQRGRAILHLRNGGEDAVTVKVSVRRHDDGQAAWKAASLPIRLSAGQIEAVDLSRSIFEIFLEMGKAKADAHIKRMQVRLDLTPAKPVPTILHICLVASKASLFTLFSCQDGK